ncbi:hypothetical protein [Sphingobium aquiterrae]|uniref:hypothetical protein n=1 Tax=Sphingobium aquiterrae TaxID=2038656 RepID=UPI003017A1DD
MRGGTIAHRAAVPMESVADLGLSIDPEPLVQTGRNWTQWIGPLLSLLILGAVVWQFRAMDLAELWRLLPMGATFWIAFILYYAAGPLSEWVIFRRLWAIPASGIGALLRKLVSNEILLGYLGEVYFYAWARRNADITTSPFGAIKDVTILSALTGNLMTLLMVAVTAPLFLAMHFGTDSKAVLLSILFVLVTSIAVMFFRRRLFTLPRAELWFIGIVHLVRIGATTFLAALMWHELLPAVGLSWWMMLATMRQLLSRLPFLPNKDVVFAGLAAFFVGRDTDIAAAMALMATLILAGHLMVGAVLGASDLVRESRA